MKRRLLSGLSGGYLTPHPIFIDDEAQVGTCSPGEMGGGDEPKNMKRRIVPETLLSERDTQGFLNEDPKLSQCGRIQWRRSGIWRWESSDGLAFAVSDGRALEIGRTARGETLDGLLRN
jgi:hypothetical protein